MSPTRWDSDDDVLEALRDALMSSRSIPKDIADAARSAFRWRARDAGVTRISLALDSSMTRESVRAAPSEVPLLLFFEGDDASLHLTVTKDVIAGQLAPPHGSSRIVVETPRDTGSATDINDDGDFTVKCPERSPVRFHLWTAAQEMVTDWVSL
jgi:hypothetical protein